MLEIVALWVVAYLILYGCGSLANRYFCSEHRWNFWVGYAMLIMYLQVYHIFFPINKFALAVPLIASLVGWLLALKSLVRNFSANQIIQSSRWVLLFSFIYCLWLANRALHDGFIDDTGLYHYGYMMWAQEFSIIPGLGNLHGRLAFNNANLLINALLDPIFMQYGSVRLANGFLIAVISCQAISYAIHICFRESIQVDVFKVSLVCFIPVIFYLAVNGIGMSTDIPNFIIGILASSLFFKIIFTSHIQNSSSFTIQNNLIHLVLLCSVGICIKLSFVVFGFLLCFSACAFTCYQSKHNQLVRILISLSWIPAVLLGVYVIRGCIQTGYPLYPSMLGGLPVDWKIPIHYVVDIADGIRSSARMVGWPVNEILNGWQWLVPWFEQKMTTVKGIWVVGIPFISSLILLAFLRRKRLREKSILLNPEYLLLSVVFLLSAMFWFSQAPSPRFAGVIFWFYFVCLLLLILLSDNRGFMSIRVITGCCILFVIGVFGVGLLKDRSALITLPSEATTLIPQTNVKKYVTQSGLILYVPDEDGAMMGLSWGAPLPATPNPKAGLSLRDPNDFGKGFVID